MGDVTIVSYHLNEKPGGGNSIARPEEKDTGTSTNVGATRKTTINTPNADNASL